MGALGAPFLYTIGLTWAQWAQKLFATELTGLEELLVLAELL